MTLFSKFLIKTQKLPNHLSSELSAAFELRQKADYDIKAQFHYQNASEELKKAERFLNTVVQFINAQKPEVED